MRRFARIPLLAIGCPLVLVGALSLTPAIIHARQADPRAATEREGQNKHLSPGTCQRGDLQSDTHA
jgi:hypothetical protein